MMNARHEQLTIEWPRLLREFQDYQLDATVGALDGRFFVESLVEPTPGFVQFLLRQNNTVGGLSKDGVKALYGYLLQKRYDEKLNLLYFVFHVFDEESRLPQEVIEQTPLPHEDGVPSYRHFGEPEFSLDPAMA
jgi:hypothetical protein